MNRPKRVKHRFHLIRLLLWNPRRMLCLFLLIPLFAGHRSHAQSQTTTIRGIVVDRTTGNQLPSTSVSLKNTKHNTLAGPDGTFEITSVLPGTYIFEVVHVRYKRRNHVFTVDQEPLLSFRIEMESLDETTLPSSVGSTASTSIRGRIIDQDSHTPVPLVNVIVRNTRFGAATDSAGRFEIRGLPPDLYMLEFRHVAYKTRLHVLPLRDDERVTINVEMEQQTIPLSEVTVTGQPIETKKLHQAFASTVVTEDQIARIGARTLTDVLRTFEPGVVPSLSPRGTRRISNLERVPFLIYVDGAYVAYIAGAMDNIVDVHQIERIEISRWVGAAPNFGPGTSDRVLQIFTKKAK